MMPSAMKIEKVLDLSGKYGSVFKLRDRTGARYIWVEHHKGYGYENSRLGVSAKVIQTIFDFRSTETMYIDVKFTGSPEENPTFSPLPGPLFEDDFKALSNWLGRGRHVKIIPPNTTKPKPLPPCGPRGPALD